MLLFAVDQYKSVCDERGLRAGALTFRRVGQFIQEVAQREEVIVARYSEDCVAAVLPDTSAAQAVTLAEWVRKGISASKLSFEKNDLHITVSVGVATAEGGSKMTAAELVELTEQALYRARIDGRDCVAEAPALSREVTKET